jgi:hypothetical protein
MWQTGRKHHRNIAYLDALCCWLKSRVKIFWPCHVFHGMTRVSVALATLNVVGFMPFFLVLDHNLREWYVDTYNKETGFVWFDSPSRCQEYAQQGDPADPALSRHAFAWSDPILCPHRMNVKGSCRLLFEKFQASRQGVQMLWRLGVCGYGNSIR